MINIKNHLKKYRFLLLLLFTLTIILLFLSMTNPDLAGLLGSIAIITSFFYNKSLPICIDMILKVMIVGGGGLVQLSQTVLILSSIILIYENRALISSTVIFLVTYMLVVLLISYNIGFNSNSNTALYMFVDILKLMAISCVVLRGHTLLLGSSIVFVGLAMSILIGYALLTGNYTVFNEGESLSFLENAKALSTAIAPLCFFAVWFLFTSEYYQSKLSISIAGAIALYVLGLIILTYSRGVMLALIGAVGYLIFSKSKQNRGKSLLMVSVVFAGIYFLISIMSFSNERIFDNLEGGNGRDGIWISFYDQMISHDCIFFGFGPGSTKDISLTGYYSHSAILDYLFCYGYAGLFYIVLFIVYVGKLLYRNEKTLFFGLFLLNILMFFPHGTSLSHMFILINGICLGQALLVHRIKGQFL